MRRVREIFALTPEPLDVPGAIDASGIRGDIRFEGVGFAYDESRVILDDITFAARARRTGGPRSGSRAPARPPCRALIPRFFEPTSGRILIDGVDTAQYALRSLRERIALVPQEAVLFGGTIADNIRYGRLVGHRRRGRGRRARGPRARVRGAAAPRLPDTGGRGRRDALRRRTPARSASRGRC